VPRSSTATTWLSCVVFRTVITGNFMESPNRPPESVGEPKPLRFVYTA